MYNSTLPVSSPSYSPRSSPPAHSLFTRHGALICSLVRLAWAGLIHWHAALYSLALRGTSGSSLILALLPGSIGPSSLTWSFPAGID